MFTAEVVADLTTTAAYATIWDVQHTLPEHAQRLATILREQDFRPHAHRITTIIQPSATAGTPETQIQAEFDRLRFAIIPEMSGSQPLPVLIHQPIAEEPEAEGLVQEVAEVSVVVAEAEAVANENLI